MKIVARAAGPAAGMVLAVLATACGSTASPPARASVQACTAFGVQAIQQRRTPVQLPPACRGLSQAAVNFALGRAIYQAAGSGRHKAAWRRAALVAGARLGQLISALPLATPPARAGPPAPAPRPGPAHRQLPGLATLLAWLVTIGLGAVMAGRRLIRHALRQVRGPHGRAGPAVLAGHFGLASTGWLVWACYLVTGWLALAWSALCLLLSVIGLGMAVATMNAAAPPRAAAGGRRRAALLPVVHGLAAMATILLAVLTTLGAS